MQIFKILISYLIGDVNLHPIFCLYFFCWFLTHCQIILHSRRQVPQHKCKNIRPSR